MIKSVSEFVCEYRVYTSNGICFSIEGKFLPELTTDNWMYFEENNELYHFRIENIVAIYNDTVSKLHLYDSREYEVYTSHTDEPFTFIGAYRRDFETRRFHCYQRINGKLCWFQKKYIVAVFGDTAKSVKQSQREDHERNFVDGNDG